ncbi:MAG: hypothetical protein JETCAE03_32490 [Ignavibacteriaceae bacterium]|nr:MAG: hypothetical protein JETCAE03_32490 [Ignavibacteriaceae bacterium]
MENIKCSSLIQKINAKEKLNCQKEQKNILKIYYRQSQHSAGNEIIDGKPNRGYWQQLAIEKIKEKYSKLYKELKCY